MLDRNENVSNVYNNGLVQEGEPFCFESKSALVYVDGIPLVAMLPFENGNIIFDEAAFKENFPVSKDSAVVLYVMGSVDPEFLEAIFPITNEEV